MDRAVCVVASFRGLCALTGPGREKELDILVRDAQVNDAAVLAQLAGQLGYPTGAASIEGRLRRMEGKLDERVIVSVEAGQSVVGWTTVKVVEHMYGSAYVEISGFVVDQEHRGQGIGKTMMAEVERWAREKGYPTIRLNANILRTGAHQFYKALGFTQAKQQYVFQKELGV
jgi:GNAT superfamily N-acetyltransferase